VVRKRESRRPLALAGGEGQSKEWNSTGERNEKEKNPLYKNLPHKKTPHKEDSKLHPFRRGGNPIGEEEKGEKEKKKVRN